MGIQQISGPRPRSSHATRNARRISRLRPRTPCATRLGRRHRWTHVGSTCSAPRVRSRSTVPQLQIARVGAARQPLTLTALCAASRHHEPRIGGVSHHRHHVPRVGGGFPHHRHHSPQLVGISRQGIIRHVSATSPATGTPCHRYQAPAALLLAGNGHHAPAAGGFSDMGCSAPQAQHVPDQRHHHR